MRSARWAAIVLCAAVVGCSGGSSPSGPSSPTPAAPTLTGLTIEGAGALLTGTSADYTVTANFSNQTTQAVAATWSGGGTDRAAVTPAGRVTGQLHGSFTLTASYQGQSASKTVNVVSNYDGRWTGVVVRMTCQLNGDLGRRVTQRLCPAGPNERIPASFTISQPAPFTDITAQIDLADGLLNARGIVTSDGHLVLEGDTEFQVLDPVSRRPEILRFSLLKWDTQLGGFTMALIVGRFDRNHTESLWQGNIYEEYTIEQMRRAQ